MKEIYFIAVLLMQQASAKDISCTWCVSESTSIKKNVVALAHMAPKKLLAEIRKRNICVKVLNSNRVVPKGTFAWGQVEKADLPIETASKITGLMGKTFCKGEHEISAQCPMLIVASDAPFSTLLHEYLHYLQSEQDPSWCPRSKAMWHRSTTSEDWKEIRDKEWDVHRFLWDNKNQMNLALDDRIAIASETLNEAEVRKNFDSDAAVYVEKNKIKAELIKDMSQYSKQMGNKNRGQ